ncbi:MAG: S1-like domain-containing RNA-binding protein [Lachnospiraceae bacterium]|nr:S1-like domain-containing RNA-binding protein [Lachnospiraceae bacterium]
MITLGNKQTLTVIRKTEFGVYLADTLDPNRTKEEEVLLPRKEVPSDIDIMDPIEVFIYKDSKDRWIATTKTPLVMLGKTATLKVKDINNVGAFLDWGLDKDLLLPYKEQKGTLNVGDEVSVSVYLDKSKRICATMWISDEEKKQSIYENNARKLLNKLKKCDGFLPLNDKSDPEKIRELTGFSKNEFKKSVGNLYKQRLIEIEENGIKLK